MSDADVAAVRGFSRTFTRWIGVLGDGLLGSGLTLPQARLLYEIGRAGRDAASPGDLAVLLGVDAGYVSRLVMSLERSGLVLRSGSPDDARRVELRLTRDGGAKLAVIDTRLDEVVSGLLSGLAPLARRRVVDAMTAIGRDLEPRAGDEGNVSLREPQCGDIGWVVHRHGALYHLEYGWDRSFEGVVAKIASEFIEQFDPARDCCRIADAGGRIVGSAFVVRTAAPGTAKLRLVYVEPEMRGTGLGARLVQDCMEFARQAGYSRMTLWTNDPLLAARRLYQRLGFEMTSAEPVTAFGHDMMSETWERDL